jgi:hypothetical protein
MLGSFVILISQDFADMIGQRGDRFLADRLGQIIIQFRQNRGADFMDFDRKASVFSGQIGGMLFRREFHADIDFVARLMPDDLVFKARNKRTAAHFHVMF